MKKKKKLIIIAAAVVVVIAAFALNATRSSEKGRSVQTEKVTAGDLEQIVSATGTVVPPTEVKISANISGRIIHIAVEEGDAVAKGDLLVELDRDRYEFAVRKARAAQKESEARLVQAELEWERQQGMYDRKLISKADYDNAQAAYEAAKYSAEQMRASLAEFEDNLGECTIHSPINGIVTNLAAKQGENVVIGTMNNPGTVIMTVSDLSVIEVEAEVDETDVAMVKIGQPVKVELDAFPDTSFAGEVVKIGNSAQVSGFGSQDQATNFLVNVRILDKVENIKPGMTSSVDITTNTRDDVLQIPIQAVVMREPKDTTKTADTTAAADADAGVAVAATPEKEAKPSKRRNGKPQEREGVFIVSDGVARFVEIKTGIADQQYIEVVSGLEAEQEIITGSFRVLRQLEDGDAVKVDNSQMQMLGRQEA
jgi:HlyD family secretion protein